MKVRAILIILEVIVDLVLANRTTIAYKVHEVKRISTFGADKEDEEGIVDSVSGQLRHFRLVSAISD